MNEQSAFDSLREDLTYWRDVSQRDQDTLEAEGDYKAANIFFGQRLAYDVALRGLTYAEDRIDAMPVGSLRECYAIAEVIDAAARQADVIVHSAQTAGSWRATISHLGRVDGQVLLIDDALDRIVVVMWSEVDGGRIEMPLTDVVRRVAADSIVIVSAEVTP